MSSTDPSTAPQDDVPERDGAGRWVFASRVAVQVSQLVIFLAAARFLTPEAFGVFALVQAFSVLLFLAAAAGWREFVMSWTGEERGVDQAITYAILGGAGMMLAGFAAAGVLSRFLVDPTAPALLALFSGCVLLSPIASAYSGVLVRRHRIAGLSLVTIAAELVGLAVSVGTLFLGWGVFALGAGKLAVQLVMLAGVAGLAKRPFRPALRAGHGRAILAISGQILANRLIGYVQSNGSTFIVGAFLGPASVGFYRAAERLVSAVAELVMEPLRLIAWVRFRQAAGQAAPDGAVKAHLAAEATRILPLFIVLAAPVFVGLALVSGELVALLLGEVWRPAGGVAAILALGALAAIPNTTTEPLLSLGGEIRRLPPVLLFNAAVAVAALAALGKFGLIAAALANPAAGVIGVAAIAWLLKKYVGVDWAAALRRAAPAALALAALVCAVLGARSLAAGADLPTYAGLGLEIAAGAGAYLAALAIVRRRLLRSALALI